METLAQNTGNTWPISKKNGFDQNDSLAARIKCCPPPKKKKLPLTWMHLETVMLNEVSQTEKGKYPVTHGI